MLLSVLHWGEAKTQNCQRYTFRQSTGWTEIDKKVAYLACKSNYGEMSEISL